MANKRALQLLKFGFDPVLLGCVGEDLQRPLLTGWQTGVYSAADLSYWPEHHNIGIRCGRQRDGRYLLVYAFDVDADRIFPIWYRQVNTLLRQALGRPLPIVSSGRGCHVFFFTEAEYPGRIMAGRYDQIPGAGRGHQRLVTFIETLGAGRQVMASGSRQPNGQRYRFYQGRLKHIPSLNAEQYRSLLLLSTRFDQRFTTSGHSWLDKAASRKPINGFHNCLHYARQAIGGIEQKEPAGGTRFLAYGGLLIAANGHDWYAFSDGKGGGLAELMAWHTAMQEVAAC